MVKYIFKKIIAITMVVCIAICTSIPLSAKARYTDDNNIILQLSFSSSGADCYAKITGGNGTTSITNCTMALKDTRGNVVKTWTNLSATGGTLIVSKSTGGVTQGKKYILSVSATVNRNGSSESVFDSVMATY